MPIYAGAYFQKYSSREIGSGCPLVLIHGAGGNHLSWPVEIRRQAGVEVYALDLPGHGKSKGPCPENIPVFAAKILRWLDWLGLPQAVLVGHSMGSAIAIQTALADPNSVKGLVLIGSGDRLTVNPRILDLLANPETYLEAVHKIIGWSFSLAASQTMKSLVEKRMLETSPNVVLSDFLACSKFDATESIARIQQPTLVVSGQEDKMTPVPGATSLAEKIPYAELRIIPDAGHMVMQEKPKQVASLLRGFLEELRCKENST